MDEAVIIKELLSYKERLEQTLRGTYSGTFSHDFKKELIYIDDMAMSLLDLEKSVLSVDDWFDIIHPDDAPLVNKKMTEGLKKQLKHIDVDYRVKSSQPILKYIQVKTLIKYKDNTPVKTYGILIDITQQKKNEIELREKNKTLEQFTSLVGHDLLSPLNSILGFAEILKEDLDNSSREEIQQYANIIIESSLRMKNLIVELLEYSRVGGIKKQEKIDCNILLKEVLEDLSGSIRESNCKISFEELPLIYGNKLNIRRLFQNLISNGIKYRNRNGALKISITARETEHFYEFSFRDNGIGIEEENISRIFHIFEKVENKDQSDGYGIGLATCKKIAKEHGGDIWVDSKPGEGSTFHFTIAKGK